MARDDQWFGVWHTQGRDVLPTYLLIIAADRINWRGIRVVDPLKQNELVFVGSTYEEVSWHRVGMKFEKPIGVQIDFRTGARKPLFYGEMIRPHGLFHVTPRIGTAG
ncbi:MAG: hypothetical protein IPK58_02740 [Acidobacteria bacterium]|nr:hypothetical protein [Acidobacteriota bacterium]